MGVENGSDDRQPAGQHPALAPPVVVLDRQTSGLAEGDSIRQLLDEFPALPLILVLPPLSWDPQEGQALKARISTLFGDAEAASREAAPQAGHDPEPCPDHPAPPGPGTSPRPHGGLAGWQIRRLVAYVDDHLSETIHVRDLAALTGLSLGHFAHAFKQSFGKPPLAHVTHRRLALACERMLASDASLAGIAQECGFCDQSHFSRHFHRTLGMTPQRWRRLHSPGPA